MPDSQASVDHQVPDEDPNVHHAWDNTLEPILTVKSGDVVRFDCRDATGGQLGPDATVTDVSAIDPELVHALTGPIAIEGAEPGDVLTVEILELEHEGWGYTIVPPGPLKLGLLFEAFDKPAIHVWEIEDGVCHFVDGIEVPLAPFPGVVGVAPAENGVFDTLSPRATGGNVDIKHLTAGSTISLPIAVENALFSIGDCHAAQGDGEVSGTGIEAPMSVTCRFELEPDRTIERPHLETDGPFTPTGRDERMIAVTGVESDLYDAAEAATCGLIDRLVDEYDLTREQAYILCSTVADLKINQVVHAPNSVVSAYLPTNIFPE